MKTNITTVTMPTSDAEILGNNPRRLALWLSSDSLSLSYINFGRSTQPSAGVNSGVSVVASNPPVRLTYEDVGDGLCLALHGLGSAGGIHITIIECLDD